ncbi:MAG: fructosamine kinase family protein [Gammaproteobacteria bacterium]|nr:fructosamine kinase family protein [Gammaproteobacteria bacterium]
MQPTEEISRQISETTGETFRVRRQWPVAGGCINTTLVLEDGPRRFFVKLNDAARRDMFEAEAEGLGEILAANALRAPRPLCHGCAGDRAWLVLEYLELGAGGQAAETALGEGLARLHRRSQPRFGWHRDNTIGATAQQNSPNADWATFFAERRLGFQLRLAEQNGHGGRLLDHGHTLCARLGFFFSDYQPKPSLLHGDLWGGNWSADAEGRPVIYDPAVYFGDREADLAMTELFGGFGASFYSAYRDQWPLDSGYSVRRTLYNLYHVLNHLNLFGGGYAGQAGAMMDRLLAECG